MADVAFLHGSGYTAESFNAQIEALPGSRALALPGHPVGRALPSVEACAEWLAERLAESSTEPAIVAGNSLGGAIALRWALTRPERTRAIILIGSGARLRVAPQIFSMIEQDWPNCIPDLVDLALGSNPPRGLRAAAIRWHEVVGKESTCTDYNACNAFDVMSEIDRLRVPTLILAGSEDRMTPLKYAQYLHAHISGSRFEVIERAGHLAMAEQPAQVNRAIREFLASL